MTPYKHAQGSVAKWGGSPEDYIELHDWFDETKMFTGDWTHRALRHHSAGIQWAIQKFGHAIKISTGHAIPTKLIAEQHIMEDCGFIPTPAHYPSPSRQASRKVDVASGKNNQNKKIEVKLCQIVQKSQ